MATSEDRYARQRILEEIGDAGQERLRASTVLIVGVGALGCAQAPLLVRAGVGRVILADRDVPDRANLHRQLLFDEADVAAAVPKAEAAAAKLRAANSEVRVEARVTDVTRRTVLALMEGADVVLDGTDNLETRYLINDASVKTGTPWIYGGVLGTQGMALAVRPGRGPCLRCLFPEPPPPASIPTCDTFGVLNAAPALVGALQAAEAFKILLGREPEAHILVTADLWRGRFHGVEVARTGDCPCCGRGRTDFLDAREGASALVLCGRNAVQIAPASETVLDLEALRARLSRIGPAAFNGYLLRFEAGAHTLLVFPDGRVVVRGTRDEAVARGLVAKYVGA